MSNTKAEDASALAIERTKKAAEAVEMARAAQSENNAQEIKSLFTEAIKDAFGREENSGRFIDTSRIPLICQDIKGIHLEIGNMKDGQKFIIRLLITTLISGLATIIVALLIARLK